MPYLSRQKAYTERKVKRHCTDELESLETISLKILTSSEIARMTLIKSHLKNMEDKKIDDYRIRTRYLPKFEKAEPNISFFSRLEKRFIKQTRICRLKDPNRKVATKTLDLLEIVSTFYQTLFINSETNSTSQKSLLKNINKTLNDIQRYLLDSPITLEELERAVLTLNKDKIPGLNGLPAVFYQMFWPVLKERYL